MAEAMLRRLLAERLGCKPEEVEERGVIVASAGISAAPGVGAAPEAIDVMRERGLDITRHESQPLSDKRIRHADLLLAMTGAHRQAIVRRWPEAAHRAMVVRMDGGDIEDPIGASAEVYQQCAAQIEPALRERVQSMELT
jgi:protein-tyrosine phosphatase